MLQNIGCALYLQLRLSNRFCDGIAVQGGIKNWASTKASCTKKQIAGPCAQELLRSQSPESCNLLLQDANSSKISSVGLLRGSATAACSQMSVPGCCRDHSGGSLWPQSGQGSAEIPVLDTRWKSWLTIWLFLANLRTSCLLRMSHFRELAGASVGI